MKTHTNIWMQQIREQMSTRALKLQWIRSEIDLLEKYIGSYDGTRMLSLEYATEQLEAFKALESERVSYLQDIGLLDVGGAK